jgi:hypothetical protein
MAGIVFGNIGMILGSIGALLGSLSIGYTMLNSLSGCVSNIVGLCMRW